MKSIIPTPAEFQQLLRDGVVYKIERYEPQERKQIQ